VPSSGPIVRGQMLARAVPNLPDQHNPSQKRIPPSAVDGHSFVPPPQIAAQMYASEPQIRMSLFLVSPGRDDPACIDCVFDDPGLWARPYLSTQTSGSPAVPKGDLTDGPT
jgi:hypothetical protein